MLVHYFWELFGHVVMKLKLASWRPTHGISPNLAWREIQIAQSNACIQLAGSFDDGINEVTVWLQMDKLTHTRKMTETKTSLPPS